MKKLTSLILILLSLKSFSQNMNENLGTIVFYRNNAVSSSAVSIKLTDTLGTVIRLYNQSYYVYNCKPGDYRFKISGQKWDKVKISVKAGRTYYYKASVYPGFWSPQYELMESDSVVANRSLAKNVHMDMNKPLIRPKNRIGIAVGAGFGFESLTVGQTEEGDVKMSFGGGVAIGGYIGRELSQYLDLEIAYRYSTCGLSPDVDNATMDFSRHIISITPAFIIPVDGGFARRIKLGLGADIYLANTLELDIPQNGKPPMQDIWKYNDTYGYHLSAIYEVNPSPRWCFSTGVRYYAASYSFSSGTKYFPLDDFFSKPNGNGFDFVIGAGFNF